MFREFKEFALRGNVVDLAIAVALGAAFGAIVNSFVQDLINPIIGLILGGTDLSNLFWVMRGGSGGPYASLEQARSAGAAVLAYGSLLNAILNFLIVAVVLFLIMKAVNRLRRAEEPTTRPCPYCTTDIARDATKCPACTSEVAPA